MKFILSSVRLFAQTKFWIAFTLVVTSKSELLPSSNSSALSLCLIVEEEKLKEGGLTLVI